MNLYEFFNHKSYEVKNEHGISVNSKDDITPNLGFMPC